MQKILLVVLEVRLSSWEAPYYIYAYFNEPLFIDKKKK